MRDRRRNLGKRKLHGMDIFNKPFYNVNENLKAGFCAFITSAYLTSYNIYSVYLITIIEILVALNRNNNLGSTSID